MRLIKSHTFILNEFKALWFTLNLRVLEASPTEADKGSHPSPISQFVHDSAVANIIVNIISSGAVALGTLATEKNRKMWEFFPSRGQ